MSKQRKAPASPRTRIGRAGAQLAARKALDHRLRIDDIEQAPYPDAWSGAKILLSVQELRAGYGAVEVLHGVNLLVRLGEIVAVLGSNGAGKTTTVNAVCGLLRPTAGSVEFAGRQVIGMPPHRVVGLGLAQVPQGRKVFPHHSVEDNLLLGAYSRRRDSALRKDLGDLLERFPVLAERRAQLAGTLSGGQQQLLAICRAMMSQPRLLVLDEPSVGLAPIVVEDVFDALRDLNARGTTILVVEQLARRALEVAHRGYVMERGQVVIEGSGRTLLEDPQVRAAYLGA